MLTFRLSTYPCGQHFYRFIPPDSSLGMQGRWLTLARSTYLTGIDRQSRPLGTCHFFYFVSSFTSGSSEEFGALARLEPRAAVVSTAMELPTASASERRAPQSRRMSCFNDAELNRNMRSRHDRRTCFEITILCRGLNFRTHLFWASRGPSLSASGTPMNLSTALVRRTS